ncbi:hypothetical protein [Roseateles noduli]|uniref:hypothetical protein n=1 Tax=Roseateles noduli TaxID=2052484 RepID=UPI003D65BD7B
MNETVALFMDEGSVMTVEGLAQCMPVWLADTSAHVELKNRLKSKSPLIAATWFPIRGGETLEEAAGRIVFSLDDHYNDLAQGVGYKYLLVFGVRFEAVIEKSFLELDFHRFENTCFGFTAAK